MNEFGRPAKSRLSLRVGRARINPADLLDVAEDYCAANIIPGVTLAVLAPHSDEPVISLEEGERRMRVPVAELVRDMDRARVPADKNSLRDALDHWIDHRPVPDSVASEQGVAVLDWTDERRKTVGWHVAVPRVHGVALWKPSPLASDSDTFLIQSAAQHRAQDVTVHVTVSADVVLFANLEMPMLSTAALANPDKMVVEMQGRGFDINNLHVVISPRHPVACATGAAATRLSAETVESHVTLPWAAIRELRWV